MGVTHKLKKEVIDFIVAQKRDNPRLGCRKLAEMTSDKFALNVSKSSVNTILKSSNLSNSVGRPTHKVEGKKFQIPTEKKQQISLELHKIPLPTELSSDTSTEAGVSADPQKTNADPVPVIPSVADNNIEKLLEKSADVEGVAVDQQQNHQQEPESPPQEVEPFDVQVARIREQNAAINKVNLKNAGIIFLLAAMWENMSQDVLGNLLSAYNCKQEKSQFDAYCIYRFLLYLLDIKEPGEEEDGFRKLLKIMDFNCDLKLGSDFAAQELAVDDKKRIINKCDLEIKQLYNMAGIVKIKMSNGENVQLDAQFAHIGQKEVSPADTAPLQATFTNLAEYVIGNHSALVLLNRQENSHICDKTAELFAAFEGIEGQLISCIEIFDLNNVSLAELSMISPRKRHLAVGLYPQQIEFKELTGAAQWATREPYYFEEADAIYNYTVTKSDFFDKEMPGLKERIFVLTLWEDNSDQPMGGILTNLQNNHKMLIKRYLRNVLEMQNSSGPTQPENGKALADIAFSPSSQPPYVEVFNCFRQFLEKYIEWQYLTMSGWEWDESLLISDIYSIQGEMYEKDGEMAVILGPNGEGVSTQAVLKMIQRVNERSIFDHNHRLVRLYQKK